MVALIRFQTSDTKLNILSSISFLESFEWWIQTRKLFSVKGHLILYQIKIYALKVKH